MYVCLCCNKEFANKDDVVKHSLKCWKEQHPDHRSTPAPQSDSITTREVNDDIANFFNSFRKEIKK